MIDDRIAALEAEVKQRVTELLQLAEDFHAEQEMVNARATHFYELRERVAACEKWMQTHPWMVLDEAHKIPVPAPEKPQEISPPRIECGRCGETLKAYRPSHDAWCVNVWQHICHPVPEKPQVLTGIGVDDPLRNALPEERAEFLRTHAPPDEYGFVVSPCPFCGGAVEHEIIDLGSGPEATNDYITECQKCGLVVRWPNDSEIEPVEVRKRWNQMARWESATVTPPPADPFAPVTGHDHDGMNSGPITPPPGYKPPTNPPWIDSAGKPPAEAPVTSGHGIPVLPPVRMRDLNDYANLADVNALNAKLDAVLHTIRECLTKVVDIDEAMCSSFHAMKDHVQRLDAKLDALREDVRKIAAEEMQKRAFRPLPEMEPNVPQTPYQVVQYIPTVTSGGTTDDAAPRKPDEGRKE